MDINCTVVLPRYFCKLESDTARSYFAHVQFTVTVQKQASCLLAKASLLIKLPLTLLLLLTAECSAFPQDEFWRLAPTFSGQKSPFLSRQPVALMFTDPNIILPLLRLSFRV